MKLEGLLLTFLPLATISKLWKIIETPARLSENKCGTLIRAYYKVLEHCGHKLREFSEEVIRPQIGTIANEVHAICGDCVSFLTDRATNFGDGVIGENIVRYWKKYISYHCSVICVYAKQFFPASQKSVIWRGIP